MMRRILAAGVLLAAFGGLAACGGKESTATTAASATDALSQIATDDKAAVELVSAKLSEKSDSVGELSEAQRNCVATALVKKLGATRVVELTAQDKLTMPQAEAEKAADAFTGCVDVKAIFAASMTDGGTFSQKSADCLAGKVSNDAYRTMIVGIFTGNQADAIADIQVTVMKSVGECLTKDELAGVGR